MFGAIKSVFGFLWGIVAFWRQRDAEMNSPEMRAAKKANEENAQVDAETKAANDQDEKTLRDNLSE